MSPCERRSIWESDGVERCFCSRIFLFQPQRFCARITVRLSCHCKAMSVRLHSCIICLVLQAQLNLVKMTNFHMFYFCFHPTSKSLASGQAARALVRRGEFAFTLRIGRIGHGASSR